MSRRKTGSGRSTPASVSGGRQSNVPLHPDTLAFVKRSLNRNDVDLAAVDKINHSLHAIKTEILNDPRGGTILLDLGVGKKLCLAQPTVTIVPKEMPAPEQTPAWPQLQDTAAAQALTPALRDMCIDFLERLHLRRKLLNRLFRRLLRVSATMDAADAVTSARAAAAMDDPSKPPPLPRYGEDLPSVPSPQAVQDWYQVVEKQHQALEEKILRHDQTAAVVPQSSEKARPSGPLAADDEAFLEYKALYTRLREAGGPHHGEATAAGGGGIPHDQNIIHYLAGTSEAQKKKPWEGPKMGTMVRLSPKEKEVEYQRWKMALLGRIPLQPTFDEVRPRVFGLEKRLEQIKKAAEEEEEQPESKTQETVENTASAASTDKQDVEDAMEVDSETNTATDETKQGDAAADNGSDAMDVEMTTQGANEATNSLEGDAETEAKDSEKAKEEDKSGEMEDGEKGDAVKEKDASEEKPAVAKHAARPISLVPVPSFYDQDLKRIKTIHGEMMVHSVRNYSRRRVQEIATDYTKSLNKSNDLNDRRARLSSQLTTLVHENRKFVAQVENNYNQELRAAFSNWNYRRQQFESARLASYMPNRNDRDHNRRQGTALTKVYAHQTEAVRQAVAFCVADIVDVAVAAGQGHIELKRFGDEFRRPPKPDLQSNENYVRNRQLEKSLTEEFATLTNQLRISEEERQKAWKRMARSKAEFEGSVGRTVDYGLMPLPSLRQHKVDIPGTPMTMSLPIDGSRVSRPTTTSTASRSSHSGSRGPPPSSDSKYSAARVKERIASDGSVAPVTAPKRTKDGLFVRPAGRTRKGMEWDAVRGIWVPEHVFRAQMQQQQQQQQPNSW